MLRQFESEEVAWFENMNRLNTRVEPMAAPAYAIDTALTLCKERIYEDMAYVFRQRAPTSFVCGKGDPRNPQFEV